VPEHHTSGKRLRILEQLKDCDALVGRSFGQEVFRDAARMSVQIILTKFGEIDEVVNVPLSGSLGQFKQFEPGKRKFAPMEE
jgi:hypothetical protein